MRRHAFAPQAGSSVLYVILLTPVLLLCLALVIDAGSLQFQRQRLQSALDVAVHAGVAVTASTQDPSLDPATAVRNIRQAILDNLAPLAPDLASMSPADAARTADVAVIDHTPQRDPFHPGAVIDRPTIEVRVTLSVPSGLLRVTGLPPELPLTLTGSADLRVAQRAATTDDTPSRGLV